MTREEAIEQLQNCKDLIKQDGQDYLDERDFPLLDMAIEALSAETDMSEYCDRLWKIAYERGKAEAEADRPTGWIPIKYHEVTESERKENGYPKDWVYFLDCEMPQDGQEILVQAKNGEIRWDVCYEDDGFSLDSGWDWKDDIIAWMPLPEPYKGGEEDE